jgi:hypothetical protein
MALAHLGMYPKSVHFHDETFFVKFASASMHRRAAS